MSEILTDARLVSENAVIAALICDPDILTKCSKLLVSDFRDSVNAKIFEAITTLHADGTPIDEVTVSTQLRGKGVSASDVVGRSGTYVTSATVPHHARVIADHRILDALKQFVAGVSAALKETNPRGELILEMARDRLGAIATDRTEGGFVNLKTIVNQVCHELDKDIPDDAIPTGLRDLDEKTGGLKRGELLILAGRPSMGKTALASVIALNVGAAGKTVAFFSLEMSQRAVATRTISTLSHVPMQRIAQRKIFDNEWASVHDVPQNMTENILIDDKSDIGVADIRSKLRQQNAEQVIDLVIIDYIQIMKTIQGHNETRERSVAELSKGLKAIAKGFNVPVLALSQLNRGVESRQEKRPMMSDLRDSGSLEQDADVVMLMYRDEYYHEDSEQKGIVEVNVSKNRNGPTGAVVLQAFLDQGRFEDIVKAGGV